MTELDRDMCAPYCELSSTQMEWFNINSGAMLDAFKPLRVRSHDRCVACRCPLYWDEEECPRCKRPLLPPAFSGYPIELQENEGLSL